MDVSGIIINNNNFKNNKMNNSKKLSLFKDKSSNSRGFTDISANGDTQLDSISQFDKPAIQTRSVSGGNNGTNRATESDTLCVGSTDMGWGGGDDVVEDDCDGEHWAGGTYRVRVYRGIYTIGRK